MISKTELEIMQYIWSINRTVTPKDIREHFSDKNWSKQAVSSFLKKLVSLGYLKMHKISVKQYYYSAIISEEEHNLLPAKKIINDIFNGSSIKFFCCLVDPKERISKEELDVLENLINQKRQQFLQNDKN